MTTLEFLSYLRHLDVKLWTNGDRLRYSAPKKVMTSSLLTELAERKGEILSFLCTVRRDVEPPPTIQQISRAATLPLSFAQQRLWFLHQLEPDNPFYNTSTAIRLHGPLNLAVLKQSLDEIVRRHETLRTTFAVIEGKPMQMIAESGTVEIPLVDLSQLLKTAEQEIVVQQLIRQASRKLFNLAEGPLLRSDLFLLSQTEHVLQLSIHHIICDDWSMGVVIRESMALYQAFSAGLPSPVPELPIQYADFAHWQRQWLSGQVLEILIAYWRQQLSGVPPLLELPTDRSRSAVQTFRGAHQSIVLSDSLTTALKILSLNEDVTLYMTLLSAFTTLLSHYTRQDDIVVGTPIANRNRAEIEEVIGFFVNTLVMRTDLSGNPSFRQLLQRVRQTCLDAYAHQDLPFEKLVEELESTRAVNHSPLFEVMFVFQNAPKPALEVPGLTFTPLEIPIEKVKFDLISAITETMEALNVVFEYNTDLFDPDTITQMLTHFETLLHTVVEKPDTRLDTLGAVLDEVDRQDRIRRAKRFKETHRQKLKKTRAKAIRSPES